MTKRYFLTVDWCEKGNRGIFCDAEGHCFAKDVEPHTALEIQEILGPFWLILAPLSQLFTSQQTSRLSQWIPLPEYSSVFGIALEAIHDDGGPAP